MTDKENEPARMFTYQVLLAPSAEPQSGKLQSLLLTYSQMGWLHSTGDTQQHCADGPFE